jgi:chromosome segregation ATPase
VATASADDESEVARLRLQLKAEKGRTAALQAELDQARSPSAAGADPVRLAAAEAEVVRLQAALAEAQTAATGGDDVELRSQVERLQSSNRELQETISANLKRIQRLTAQAGGAEEVQSLQRQVTALQQELEAAKAAQASATGAVTAGSAMDPRTVRLVQDLNGYVKSFLNELDGVADAFDRSRSADEGERQEAASELPEALEKCQLLGQDIKTTVRDLRIAVEGA